MPAGQITQEMLAQYKKRVGRWFSNKPWNEVATRDAFRHFARGIGDPNPLWWREDYARKTRWGGPIAPPCYLYTYARGGGLPVGLPGVQALWCGDDWEWYAPARVGDVIAAYTRFSDLVEKKSEHAGRTFDQTMETVFVSQRGEVVSKHLTLVKRFEKATVRTEVREKRYQAHQRHCYSSEELRKIDEGYASEVIRGATPRFWEDVQVGDELTPTLQGPLTVTEMVAWYSGAGAPLALSSHILWDYFRKHPGANIPDPETNVPDVPERIHWDETLARIFGAPDIFDVGVQRLSWLSRLVTTWMGDDGFLCQLDGQTRRLNLWGDTTWCKGRVIKKLVKDGQHRVVCELWGENQRGEVTAPGHATVALPSRARGPVPLPPPPRASDLGIPAS